MEAAPENKMDFAPDASQEPMTKPTGDDNSHLDNKIDADPSTHPASALRHSEKDISNTAPEDKMDFAPDASQGPMTKPTGDDNSHLDNNMDVNHFAAPASALRHSEKDISNTALEDKMDFAPDASQGPMTKPTGDDNTLKKRFFVQLEGKTKEAHQHIVTKLKDIGHIQVESVEESEILLVFCPIVSRVGTDIGDALANIPDGKKTILVVMHPTFKPDQVVADSSKLVKKQNVKLTVDCLFYDGKLLNCNRNKTAWASIQGFVGVPPPEVKTFPKLSSPQGSTTSITPQQDPMAADPSTHQASTSQSNRNDNSNSLKKRFFVQLEGKTNEAHQDFVTRLKDIGHIQVESAEESEILLVFCPIVSRVGTDIGDALANIPDGKKTILVVMHPTFKPDQVVADSRKLVKKQNVELTVDCLFYDGKLLNCDRNETAWASIQGLVGVPPPEASQNPPNRSYLNPFGFQLPSFTFKKPKWLP